MKLFRFFKGHLLAVVICAILLVVQANLELSLPNYMSNIVDVGLQQSGISSPVPKTIRASVLYQIESFMSPEDAAIVDAVYSVPDSDNTPDASSGETPSSGSAPGSDNTPGNSSEGTPEASDNGIDASGDIRSYIGSEAEAAEGGEIAKLMELPECQVLALEEGSAAPGTAAAAAAPGTGIAPASATDADAAGAPGTAATLDALPANLVAQRAITFVQREYVAQGIDLQQLQNDYLLRTAGIMFALCLGTLVTTICVGLVAARTAATIARDTRRRLFARVMSFSPAEVGRFSQASLITRTTNDLQQVQMVCVMILRMVMLAPIMGIVAFAQVTATRTGMEWIIGVALLALFAVLGVLFGTTMPRFKRMQSLVDRLNLVSRDMLDGIMPIRAFGREPFELARFDRASTDLMRTQLFVNRAMSFMMPAIMLVMNLVALLIVWVGCQGVDVGNLQVGTMMAFITYTMQIIMSFMMLGMISVMLPRAQVSAERVTEVLECEPTITNPAHPTTPGAIPGDGPNVSPLDKSVAKAGKGGETATADARPTPEPAPRGVVEFRDVTFAYPDAERPVIHDISFRTEMGRTLGIIGSTGSGKSTLIKLIPRLYDATAGQVLLDGVDVRAMDLSDVRSRIGYVPQQGFLFSGTIESNIKFADESMPDAQMIRAAEIAQATEFIDREPEGYQTPIAQKGTNVSGGQRQRLSIARALAAEPEVLVFDDAFSALDYATDAKLREALRTQLGKGSASGVDGAEVDGAEVAVAPHTTPGTGAVAPHTTPGTGAAAPGAPVAPHTASDAAVIIVAQRVATIMQADEILVLENGAVVGRGTHAELLDTCETYREIALSQLSASELGLSAEEATATRVKGGAC